jgi:ABA4-like protein
MIDPGDVFEFTRFLALGCWLALALSLFVRGARPVIWPATQYVLPSFLCLCYLLMVWQGRGDLNLPGSFTVLRELKALYQQDAPLVASWLHFLALDMFVGTWIARDGTGRGMPLLLILFCLPFAFLFAPAGLLLYIVLRFAVRPRPVTAASGIEYGP